MGIDVNMAIRFKTEPTEKQLGQLKFHLHHRFDILDHPVIKKVDYDIGAWDEVSADDGNLYNISVTSRYYGEGYERGRGLELSALLIFLCRHEDIKNVYYGGDDHLVEYTEKMATSLLNYWIQHGNIPYIYNITNRLGKEAPTCPNCFMPMIPGITSRASIQWVCLGHDFTISTPRKDKQWDSLKE